MQPSCRLLFVADTFEISVYFMCSAMRKKYSFTVKRTHKITSTMCPTTVKQRYYASAVN